MLDSNVVMWDKTLSYDLIDPYKALSELNKNGPEGPNAYAWCHSSTSTLADTLIGSATDNADNYLLDELVGDFSLSSELFVAA